MRSANCFFSCPTRPDSPSRLSASLPRTCASNWSISSSENGPLGLRLRVFLVVSVIHGSFIKHDDMTSHTKFGIGSSKGSSLALTFPLSSRLFPLFFLRRHVPQPVG